MMPTEQAARIIYSFSVEKHNRTFQVILRSYKRFAFFLESMWIQFTLDSVWWQTIHFTMWAGWYTLLGFKDEYCMQTFCACCFSLKSSFLYASMFLEACKINPASILSTFMAGNGSLISCRGSEILESKKIFQMVFLAGKRKAVTKPQF